jgi:hypothetical protein
MVYWHGCDSRALGYVCARCGGVALCAGRFDGSVEQRRGGDGRTPGRGGGGSAGPRSPAKPLCGRSEQGVWVVVCGWWCVGGGVWVVVCGWWCAGMGDDLGLGAVRTGEGM